MDKPTIEEFKSALEGDTTEQTSAQSQETVEETHVEATSEDPLKAELERVKGKKTPAEKARDSLYFNAKEAIKHGIDPTKDDKLKEIFGITEPEVDDEDKPVTKKELAEMLTTMRTTQAAKTATELALGIENEIERELVLHHLENTVKSTGDAEEDLRNARALANAARNQQFSKFWTAKPQSFTNMTDFLTNRHRSETHIYPHAFANISLLPNSNSRLVLNSFIRLRFIMFLL